MLLHHCVTRPAGNMLRLPHCLGLGISRLSSSVSATDVDLAIIGGGIVGAASALEIKKRFPALKIAILEKEAELAAHQSGHNSGVIHAGIYYKPGSLKAKLCVKGMHMAYKYCDEHNIPYKKVGKLIVAVDESELPGLEELHRRGRENGVPGLEMVDEDGIREIEPYCRVSILV